VNVKALNEAVAFELIAAGTSFTPCRSAVEGDDIVIPRDRRNAKDQDKQH